jgi:hypothetical protein
MMFGEREAEQSFAQEFEARVKKFVAELKTMTR